MLLAVSEFVLVFAGLLVAVVLHSVMRGVAWYPLRLEALTQLALVTLVYELCLYGKDIYDPQVTRSRISMFVRLLEAFGISSLILAFLYFALPGIVFRQGVALIAAPMIMVMILGWRLLLGATGMMSRRTERAVVLGTGPVGIATVREICNRPDLNLEVVGFLDEDPLNVGKPLVNPGIVATIDELEQVVKQQRIDRIIVSLPRQRQRMPISTLLRLKCSGIAVEDAGALLERITGRIHLDQRDSSWLVFSEGFHRSRLVLFVKRTIDILVSAILVLLSLPIMAMMALAVVAETGFPVVFRQKRIGLHRVPFEMWKFRSMYQNAEARGPSWAKDGDRRITRVGQIIRKYRLDELPQLLNVLRGDMSLVGPRPEQPYFCDLLEKEIPIFDYRYEVRPGITGWAQIKYRYGASIEDAVRKLELDLFYIKHMSLTLDLMIILETMKVVLLGRGSQ